MPKGAAGSPRGKFPRVARVNSLLREVIAEELERLVDADERLSLLTVTAVEVEPDLRNAKVYFAELPDVAHSALENHRSELQSRIARQVRMSRTPHLAFVSDPALAAGLRVEEIIRKIAADGATTPKVDPV